MSDELKERLVKYVDFVKPTYIENWPIELYNMSIAQVDIPVPDDIVDCILSEKIPARLIPEIQKALDVFPMGAFIRLGSRSPKDSWTVHDKGMKTLSAKDAVESLGSSMRVFDDLFLAKNAGYKPHLFVRKWIDIPKWAEFRCFMHKRQLRGISQYYCIEGEYFPEIENNKESIQWAITKFFKNSFKEASHMDSVVFDVFINVKKHGNESEWEVKLLEINPFFADTFPGLFKWEDGGDFDGSFRMNKKKKEDEDDGK